MDAPRLVFISYSTDDGSIAGRVCELLEAQGIGCWIAPRDVMPGHIYGEQVIEAIRSTRVMVLLLSDSANNSLFVSREVERAVNYGKIVIPLRVQNVQPSTALELFVSHSQWIDAWAPPLDSRVAVLATAIRGLLQLPPLSNTGGALPTAPEPVTAQPVVPPAPRSQEPSPAPPPPPDHPGFSGAAAFRRNRKPILLGLGSVALILVVAVGALMVSLGSGSTAAPTPTPVAAASSPATPTAQPSATPVPAPTATQTSASTRYDGMVVGLAHSGVASGWRKANTASFEDTAQADGVTLKVKDAKDSYATQVKQLTELIADPEVKVVVLEAVRYDGYDDILKSARASGKIVIVEDVRISSSPGLYYTYVGPDFVAEGQKGAAAMCTLLSSKSGANVLEVAGEATNNAAADRANGFRQAMGECGIKVVATRTANWDQAKAQQVTTSYLRTDKNVQGVLAHNDSMAVGVIKGIQAAGLQPGRDIAVVGFDGTSDGFAALISGQLGADVECSPDAAPVVYRAAWNALQSVPSPSTWIPTQDQVFFSSQGPDALRAILAKRKY